MGGFTFYPGAESRMNRAVSKALEATARDIADDLYESKTLPFASEKYDNRGTLQRRTHAFSENGKTGVVSEFFGSKRMYLHPEFNFNKSENPNAGGAWFEPYIGGSKRAFGPRQFAKHVKEVL